MGRHRKWLILVPVLAGLMLFSACDTVPYGTQKQLTTTTQATSVPADDKVFSGAKGRWRAYSPYRSLFWAISPNYVWLKSPGQLAQINLLSGEASLFTVLNGLPLERNIRELVTSHDDRAILLLQDTATLFLWSPKQGWTCLPAIPGKDKILTVCFDLDGTILAVPYGGRPGTDAFGTELYEYVKGSWQLRREIPACEQVIPMNEGFALRLASPRNSGPSATCEVVLLKKNDAKASDLVQLGTAKCRWPQMTVWLGGKLLEYRLPNWNNEPNMPAVRELTADGYKNVIMKSPIAIDFKTQRFMTPQGGDIPWPSPSTSTILFRDKAGRIWDTLFCWENGLHSNRGPRLLPVSWMQQVADPTRCDLDMTDGFKTILPSGAAELAVYDASTRRGCVQAFKRDEKNGGTFPVIRCVELDKDGKSQTLFEVEEKEVGFKAMPQVLAPDGTWWGCVPNNPKGIFRITPDKKVKKYTLDISCTRLLISPKGTLLAAPPRAWLVGGGEMVEKGSLHRFDTAKERFEPDPDAWNDLSFRIGSYELAVFAPITNFGVQSAQVMQKVDGKWQPFKVPFSNSEVSMAAGSISGQRMLLTVQGLGIVEYDGKQDRWVRLEDDGNSYCHYGVFDGRGRRILMTVYHAIIYDGDPFESKGWQADNSAVEDEKLYRTLLAQLDSDQYKVREKATQDMRKLAPKVLALLQQAATDQQLTIETRERVKFVLASIPKDVSQNGGMPALLRYDCPIVSPPAARP